MDGSLSSATMSYLCQSLEYESAYAVLEQNKLHSAAGNLDYRIHRKKLRNFVL
jgi:hypothetical protein